MDRHNAFTRRNKKGDKEFVVKKKGKQDEETLNELDELADILVDLLEGIEYAGPLPSGGGAGSPEQLDYQKNKNQPDAPVMVGASGDGVRMAGESPNNTTASTAQMADGPEDSRAKSKLKATARGTPPRNKYITGYSGDNIDYGATHSESFTGTGAIAIGPGTYQVKDDDDEEEDDDNETESENTMSRKNVINEWDPAFKAAGYEPGDHQMPSPTGDGVAKRKAKQDSVGKYDTATSNQGKEWPGSHNETPAMCDVDEDGVENKPQGSHESTHADATDGHQTNVGHDWPAQPKNDGSGVAEPQEGNRWSDGGELTGGSGQDEFSVKQKTQKMPTDGPITGTSGPQLGQMEDWSPELIGTLLGEDTNLQSLFDSYARQAELVCLEDFQQLCNAHGVDAILDEASVLQLMHTNEEFIFYEGVDANGPYWTPTPFAEGKKPWEKSCGECGTDPCECEGDDCGVEEGRQRPFDQPISELQVRPPQDEAMLGQLGAREEDAEFGEFAGRTGLDTAVPGDPDLDPNYQMDSSNGPGPYGMQNAAYDTCPECGFTGNEEMCPECGGEMSEAGGMGEEGFGGETDPELATADEYMDWEDRAMEQGGYDAHDDQDMYGDDDEVGPMSGWVGPKQLDSPTNPQDDLDAMMREPPRSSMNRMESKTFSPELKESLTGFMKSARGIIGDNHQQSSKNSIGEALNQSWRHYVGGFDPRQASAKVQTSLQELMKKFPTFNPLSEECDAMGNLGGVGIATAGDGPKDKPITQPTDTTEMGEPLGKKQKNNLDGTPVIKGTEKKLTGNSKSVKENAEKLAKYVRRQLQESAPSVQGKYAVRFTCLVQEGNGSVNRTGTRSQLAEAVADLEELLQLHDNDSVVLEAYFTDGNRVVLKHKIPMIPVAKHGPLVSEDTALFRFNRHAEHYADGLVSEGFTCKLVPHNWGAAVQVLSEKKKWIQKALRSG